MLGNVDPELPGFTGPVEVVEALVAESGHDVVERTQLRLFGFGTLVEPRGVPGQARRVDFEDVPLVAERSRAFAAEAHTTSRPAPRKP